MARLNTRTTRRRRKTRITRRHVETEKRFWDVPLLICTLILLVIGVIAVFEASVVEAYQNYGDQLHFVKLQLRWSLVGLIGLSVAGLVPVRLYKQLALPALIVSLSLLLLILIPSVGKQVGGAQRWLDLGFFSLQPSEVVKVGLILYFAALFERSAKLIPFLGSLGGVAFLIMLQPDLGTTIVIAIIGTGLYYLAGAKLSHILMVAAMGVSLGSLLILGSPYRRARLMTFLDPNADPLGSSYHIRQIIISLGSGGFWGTGIGRSLQKYQYLPESTTDSIFAVIAEETGYIGTLIIFGLYSYFAYRGFKIAQNTNDTFYKLVASGLTIMIVIQAYLNLSAMGALVPLTGITLPFISYGGSSLVMSLLAVGILLNISRYTQTDEKKR